MGCLEVGFSVVLIGPQATLAWEVLVNLVKVQSKCMFV